MSKLMIQDKRMPKKNGAKASAYNRVHWLGQFCVCVFCIHVWIQTNTHTCNTYPGKSNWQEIADFLCRQLPSETQLTGEMKMISSVLSEFSSWGLFIVLKFSIYNQRGGLSSCFSTFLRVRFSAVSISLKKILPIYIYI